METLEKSRMCRLCGKQSGIAIDIFDKNENHVRKINAILPILVHEMDLLPKQMCHRCSYKLEEFYNFYVDCAKTDTELKGQLSWMRKENLEEKIITPMVKMNRFKIKTEPPDNNDSIDPNDILGHRNESSLLFPASFLQHNFDPNTSPMLSCSRCRCLCNRSIKINKKSPKQIKTSSKLESENLPHSSNVISNASNKTSELNEPKSVDNNFTISKSLFDDINLKKMNVKEIQIDNLDNNECVKPHIVESINLLRSDKLDRALRPRKGSVDYMGQKRKGGLTSNLKAKFKSKLDMLDPSIVNPVNITVAQGNSILSSPIIKLEKVEDTMNQLRTLRTRKNLEEFNKRIKEFQRKKNSHRNHNHSKKILEKEDIQNKQFLFGERNQNKQNLQSEENQISKSLQKDEYLNRKSLHKEDNQIRKSLQKEDNQIRKSLQKEENQIRKSLHKEENQIRKSLQREDNQIRKSTQREENQISKSLQREENQIQMSLQVEEIQSRKSLQADDSQSFKKNLQTEESQTKNSLQTEENEKIEQCSTPNIINDTNGIIMVAELKIKQEIVNKTLDNNELLGEQSVQEKPSKEERPKDINEPIPVERLPLCAVVKLEKDYTCNVDYPRIKIKRHLAVANPSKSQDGALDIMEQPQNIFELALQRKSFTKSNINLSPKNLRSKEKRLKVSNKNKSGKLSKKKEKQLELINAKRAVSDKGPPITSKTELKRYCEDCDICFKNKELFKLHPCYQK